MIITYPLNGIQYTAEDAESYLCTRTSGVYSAEDNFTISVAGDRQITIAPGLAWINNGEFTGKSVLSTEAVTLNIPVSDGALDRIDRIVLRFDKAQNRSYFLVLTGVPEGTPAAPTISRTALLYDLALYDVRVPAGSISINAGDITSRMLDESLCGLMRDGVTRIPTAQLQNQAAALMVVLQSDADELISQLRNEIQSVQDGSAYLLKSGGVMSGAISFKSEAIAEQTRRNLGVTAMSIDSAVTDTGTNPVTGAAIAAYVKAQIDSIINLGEVMF